MAPGDPTPMMPSQSSRGNTRMAGRHIKLSHPSATAHDITIAYGFGSEFEHNLPSPARLKEAVRADPPGEADAGVIDRACVALDKAIQPVGRILCDGDPECGEKLVKMYVGGNGSAESEFGRECAVLHEITTMIANILCGADTECGGKLVQKYLARKAKAALVENFKTILAALEPTSSECRLLKAIIASLFDDNTCKEEFGMGKKSVSRSRKRFRDMQAGGQTETVTTAGVSGEGG